MLPEIVLIFLIGFSLGAILCSLLLFVYLSRRQQVLQDSLQSKHELEKGTLNRGRDRVVATLEQRTGALRVLEREHKVLQERLAEVSGAMTTAVADLQSTYEKQAQLQEQNRQLQEDLLVQNSSQQNSAALIAELQKCKNELIEAHEAEKKLRENLIYATNRLQQALHENQALQHQLLQQHSSKEHVVGLGFAELDELQPVHAIRLFEHNIQSMADLAIQEPESIAAYVDVPIAQAAGWITQSQVFLKQIQGVTG